MTEQTAASKMIQKFWLELAEKDGQVMVKIVHGNPSKAECEALKAAKPEIIAELQSRAASKASREAAEKAEEDRQRSGMLDGSILITPSYHDGEYLSGWQVYGQVAEMLHEIKIAKHINGWGYRIQDETVEALGKSFTYAAAVEYMRPAKEASEKKATEKQAVINAKYAEAKATGRPVVLRTWSTDCCDPDEDCDIDNHRELAMPDGTTKHEWNHCW